MTRKSQALYGLLLVLLGEVFHLLNPGDSMSVGIASAGFILIGIGMGPVPKVSEKQ